MADKDWCPWVVDPITKEWTLNPEPKPKGWKPKPDPVRDKLHESLVQYAEFFGATFPTIPLLYKGSEVVIEIISKCIENKKDVYQMGYLRHPSENPDIVI